MTGPTLLWLREDLRVADHEALVAACADGDGVVALWVREEVVEPGFGPRPLGAATRWWTHESLRELARSLAALGVPLVFARGDARQILAKVAETLACGVVRWQRRYAPDARELDAQVKQALSTAGVEAHSHPGALLVEPWTVTKKTGDPFSVFTPFHRAAAEAPVGPALAVPSPVAAPSEETNAALERLRSDGVLCDLDDLALLDRHPEWWRDTVALHWTPGEDAARARLADVEDWLGGYRTTRDDPADGDSTSRLSPHLRAGEVSPRTLWHAAHGADVPAADRQAWVRQLYWREFCWHLAFHRRDVATRPMRAEFEAFPYRPDEELLRAWQRGKTGYLLVDAGMRQLWETGWMHNRVRMVTASFLTKNLLQPWSVGEQWFWDTLVDADEANNPVSWQWVAGTGADAAPYFRVFNPELQRTKFDPAGRYTGRWASGGHDGATEPVVDLATSRKDALEAYEEVRGGRALRAPDAGELALTADRKVDICVTKSLSTNGQPHLSSMREDVLVSSDQPTP